MESAFDLPSDLEDVVLAKFDEGVRCGNVFYQPSEAELVSHNGFQVRLILHMCEILRCGSGFDPMIKKRIISQMRVAHNPGDFCKWRIRPGLVICMHESNNTLRRLQSHLIRLLLFMCHMITWIH